MSDSSKPPRTLEEIQKELKNFFKEKFGADMFTVSVGPTPAGKAASGDDAAVPEDEGKPRRETLDFRMTPREVKAYLDRFVIGQEEAKRTLAVAVCDHYNHVKRALQGREADETGYIKQNVILLGPTGVGKTYLVRILAQLVGVPFVKADITKFSETGYVGGDVDDLVRELVRIADGDEKLASYGIIYLDEIDKIAAAANAFGRDPSGRGVQVGLLKLMEDTDVALRSPMDLGAQFQDLLQMRKGVPVKRTINTRHILFVVSGAFSGLGEIIERRLKEHSVGFSAPSTSELDSGSSLLSRVATRDFVEYGYEPEFVGRLPIRVALDDLTEDDLYRILKTSEGSILAQYLQDFESYGLQVAFSDEALRAIARKAFQEKTGARGLMTVLESCLRDFKFHLPGGESRSFAVTACTVEDPVRELERVRRDPDGAAVENARVLVAQFEDAFEREFAVRLKLDEAAVVMAAALAKELQITLEEYLRSTFADHAEFLRKVQSQSGQRELLVTPQVLSRPGTGVELWFGRSGAG